MILETAYANQTDGVNGKSDWNVLDKDGNNLGSFPKNLNEKQIMSIIKFGREYEAIGFADAMKNGKDYHQKDILELRTFYENKIQQLISENGRIAEALDKSTKRED